MFIRIETGAIINSDHVIRIETVRKHLEWRIQDANIYEIYAYITSMDTESRVLIGTYQDLGKAQEIMDKIYLCLDANRSLDFFPKKVNKGKRKGGIHDISCY